MSKVDRNVPRSITNPQTRQAETPSRAQATSGAAPVQAAQLEVPAAVTGQTEFAQLAAALAELQPQTAHVARSADPGALWGQQQPGRTDYRARFAAATTREERMAIRAEVHAERAQCEGKINERSEKLERRWRRMSGAKRHDILKEYSAKGGSSPALKAKIEAANQKSLAMQAEIDALAAKLKATYPAKTPEENAARRELKVELVELRKHQREVLNALTDEIAAEGKKLELLATNEQKIDTTGSITKDGESLLSMIGKWLGFTQVLNSFDLFLEQNKVNLEEQRRRIELENLEKSVQEGDLRKKIQLKGDLEQRELLKQLSQRIDGVRKG